MSVLDFGSGAGRDCFVLSKLVGQDGFVTGVDMTDEQVQADIGTNIQNMDYEPLFWT